MANFVILHSTGNLVSSFDREDEARAELEAIVLAEPDDADEYALLTYGDDGLPIGNAVLGVDLAHA